MGRAEVHSFLEARGESISLPSFQLLHSLAHGHLASSKQQWLVESCSTSHHFDSASIITFPSKSDSPASLFHLQDLC